MTPQKAIQIIEVAQVECEWNAPLEYQGAFDAAIEALEKQIPMKPLPKKLAEQQPFGNNPVYVIPCGSCGEPLNFLFPYCPWCGQKIDWTEGEG